MIAEPTTQLLTITWDMAVFAKSFKRKRKGLIFENNLQTAQEIPLEGIVLIASYFNTVLQPILILKPKLPCIVLAIF